MAVRQAVDTESNVLIRRLGRHELSLVYALCRTCFSVPYSWETLLEYRRRARDGFFVAEVDGDVQGFCITTCPRIPFLFGRSGEIVLLAVSPTYGRRGIGRALLSQALTHLRSKGMARARLHVDVSNLPAQKLYKGAGMVVSHVVPNYYRDGSHAYRMVIEF